MAIERWNIDTTHSNIDFIVRHMVVSKVRGHFHKWSGEVVLDTADLSKSTATAKIEVGSLDTRDAQRDGHLKSPDFFDVEKYPEITFTSGKVTGSGEKFEVTGALTIHGATHEVVLQVEALGQSKDPWGHQRAGFSAKTHINRKDFGMTFNKVLDNGGVMVSEKVEIEIEVEAVQVPATAA